MKFGFYKGRKVKLNSPFYTPGESKKMAVYVEKNGKVLKVRFGDPNMKNKSYIKKNRDNFRERHRCENATDVSTARYWSCAMW